MKFKLIFIIFCVLFSKVQAQNLWEQLPLTFNYLPNVMYYDSTDDVSYIAGAFTKVNDTPCNIVQYNGHQFSLLPSSPLYTTGDLINYHGKLYASGYGIATWDGQSWTVVDSEALITDMYLYDDKLYFSGFFDSIAGQPISQVAVWNDTVWTDLYRVDTISVFSPPVRVYRVINYKNHFYVAGNIDDVASDSLMGEMAMFDGQHWVNVGGQIKGDDLSGVNELYIWKDTLYVGGQFKESSGAAGNSIAKWDGSHWHRLNKGLLQNSQAAVTDMVAHNDALYTCGWFYIVDGRNLGPGSKGFAKWDGQRWCTMGTSADGTILRFGHWRNELYIMGGFHHINGQAINFIAKWVGGDYTDSCSQPQTNGIRSLAASEATLKIYPNPVSGLLKVAYTNKAQNHPVTIKIIDVFGRECQQYSYPSQKNRTIYTLDAKILSAGMYVLEIDNGGNKATAKFVKL